MSYQAFWFRFAVSRLKLTLFRIAFFSLVGYDAFRQIGHTPRYGAGDFNVSHVPWLDWALPSPTREGMLLVFLLQCYLAFRVALGAATKTSVRLLAGLYGYAYLASQLDSYQHHYLVFLLLVVCSFVPWDSESKPADDNDDATPARKDPKKDQKRREGRARAAYPGGEVVSWALRLIYVQLAIVYAWAAISKMGPQWIDGTTLNVQIQEQWARDLIEGLFGSAYKDDPGGFAIAAKLVIATELLLPVLVVWRKLWVVALPVGVTFHLGVELAGLKIGLFSYLMCAVYVLMVPEWVLSYLAHWVGKPVSAAVRGARDGVDRLASPSAIVAALAVGSSILMVLPYDIMWLVMVFAGLLAIAAVLAAYRRERTVRAAHAVAAAHLAVCLIIVGLSYSTDQSFDYYKYWAGSARRLGPPEEAREAYIELTERHPEYGAGHYHLGEIYRKNKEASKALESYTRAVEHAPDDYRAYVGQARIYTRIGDGAKAYEAATRALQLNPDDTRARRIQRRFADLAPQSTIDAP